MHKKNLNNANNNVKCAMIFNKYAKNYLKKK